MTKINFTGSLEEVKQKIESTIATYELLGNQSAINFEQWYESWENGWPESVENRALGNYPLSGENQGPAKAEVRSRWRQFSKTNGIIKGEYWRDRSREKESVRLSGTSEQLIDQIIKLEIPSAAAGENKSKSHSWPPMKGQPQIKLYFRGEGRAEGETCLRIMNKTDDPKIPLPLIDKSDLLQYAIKIKEQFATPNLFVWQKGKEIMSYENQWQGFRGQYWLCRNEASGKALLTKLVNVLDLPLDNSKIRMSRAIDEALAFPASPPDVIVLNESVPQETERPLVDVSFWRAEIKLAKRRAPIPLVERGAVVYT